MSLSRLFKSLLGAYQKPSAIEQPEDDIPTAIAKRQQALLALQDAGQKYARAYLHTSFISDSLLQLKWDEFRDERLAHKIYKMAVPGLGSLTKDLGHFPAQTVHHEIRDIYRYPVSVAKGPDSRVVKDWKKTDSSLNRTMAELRLAFALSYTKALTNGQGPDYLDAGSRLQMIEQMRSEIENWAPEIGENEETVRLLKERAPAYGGEDAEPYLNRVYKSLQLHHHVLMRFGREIEKNRAVIEDMKQTQKAPAPGGFQP